MKLQNTAHFDLVKMQNKRIIRNLLRSEHALTIAKIAEKVGLSYPTVSSLLKELTKAGETRITKEPEIRGGRPGICYELNPSYQYAFILYFDGWELKGQVYDAYGSPVKSSISLDVTKDIKTADILHFIESIQKEYPTLSTVCIGIPGAVREQEIIYLPKFPNLEGQQLAVSIETHLGVQVFIENDINAIAFSEVGPYDNFAHIVYIKEDCCMGVGIVLNGEIVKGCQGYAGEMEFLCSDLSNQHKTFVTAITALTCVLNLPTILLSGDFSASDELISIKDDLANILPKDRIPALYIENNIDDKYENGLLKQILAFWSHQDS